MVLPFAMYYHTTGNIVITGLLWFFSGAYGFRPNDPLLLIGIGIPLGLPIIVTAVVLQLYLHERITRRTTRLILYFSIVVELLIVYLHPVFHSYLPIPIPFASIAQITIFRGVDDQVDLY